VKLKRSAEQTSITALPSPVCGIKEIKVGNNNAPVNHTGPTAGLHNGAEAAILQVHSYQIFTLEIYIPHVRVNRDVFRVLAV